MDNFDDIFESPAPHAQARPAGGKFEPMAKACPKKETSAILPSMLASDIEEKAGELSSHSLDAAQLASPVDVADDRLEISTSSCLSTLETNGTDEALKKHEDSLLGVADDITKAEKSFVGSIDCFQREGGAVNDNGDMHSGLNHPADIGGLVVGYFIESTLEPIASDVRISGEHENSVSDPSATPDTVKENPVIGFDIVESVQLGVRKSAKKVDSMLSGVDPLGDVLFDPATSNARVGQKFRPKIKPQPRMGVSKAAALARSNIIGRTGSKVDMDVQHGDNFLISMATRSEETSVLQHVGSTDSFILSHMCALSNLFLLSFTQDPVTFSEAAGYEVFFDFETCEATIVYSLNYSSARYSDSNAFAATTEIQGDAEKTNHAEATHSDGTILGDMNSEDGSAMLGEVGCKSGSGKAPTESNPLRRCKRSSRASEGIEGETSSRQLVDEPNDDAHHIDGSTNKLPSNSNRDENEDKDDDYMDKSLLEVSEDEIDHSQLPIRDLILLAELRERVAIKEVSKQKPPQTNLSLKSVKTCLPKTSNRGSSASRATKSDNRLFRHK
ncbi:hypothetical protein UlMin_046162, partial [Ulmus minor]